MDLSPSSPDESTSASLIAEARRHLPDAWRRIHTVYGPLVYAWCREWRVPEQDAIDLVQDVFRAVIRNLDTFRHQPAVDGKVRAGSFRGWIWTITRNKVRDYRRRSPRRPLAIGGSEIQQQLLQIPADESESTDGAEPRFGELVRQVLRLIRDEFESRTWDAFWQVTVDGRSAGDVAERLGMSEGAVRQAKYRVLRRLRDELESVG
ncbi:MAG TPA: sigma-70 family RNA polymerase sigma factor [Pirellulaceae bacterium]|nr:sigma-70 family RNA polymerase sigma factor [Pirellulaceae bacterium]